MIISKEAIEKLGASELEQEFRAYDNRIARLQERIAFLESLLKEIEEHEHCNGKKPSKWLSDGTVLEEAYTSHAEGHRCAAEIAKKWREK
jgi:hypothetical protein